jgi:hypothetical protein
MTELRRLAEAHQAELLADLSPYREVLTSLLRRLAHAHSLDEGVHPGYRIERT